ncbi:tetratricopeptide repeat protein [Actinoplanes sp. LDG1-06]|uniref:Tetratricopeptide repeat protein n=1 Tax=Paractinoplanes ovalisporus TaxID=2810368 RepID=A0ABS2ABQ4_9ACTN|nr:BTAD domain-containing putative transcriptional regulator [Actinoplanes ovalisporus]MBM2617266.1 tetratricopeptide repeat protein [Actinoplanes ovalisporus]
MRYRILGPLSVTVDGQDVAITAGRDRIVLAMLLLHAGRVLGVGTLAEAVWGAEPPATARGQLQTCVSRLRRSLPAGAIRSDPAGYCLGPGPGELDAAEFTRLVADARENNDPALYRRALDLWRGDAAAGLDSHGVRLAAAVLDQQHVAALEGWAELEIAAGRDRDLIGELVTAVDRFPLREKLSGQLMRALHRSGRQADALGEYQRVRSALRDELGLDPGRELQELHTAMLSGALSEPARPAQVRCLPRTVGDFTGRVEVVRRLVAAIDGSDTAGPVVAVIDGMAGSGKTTLALHVATLLGDRYPDAHLFVDLQGHSDGRPVEPAAALLVLLRQLGVEAERIPPGLVDRVGLWRTELARRRTLVLFDNAASSAQLADLLPTAPGSLALITGRRRLLGLDGVHPESLPLLSPDEAVTLLARIAGPRVWADPDGAAEVARRCGCLPLALRLAGARLAHRPRWQVADLVRRLGDSALPELAAEDRSVASAFAVSYRQLPEATQRVFRLLGVGPASEFDAFTVAALGGLPLEDAREILDDLVDVHLVEEPEPEVYRLHDLLREFAAALGSEIAPGERVTALRGLLDQQLHAAAATNLPAYRAVLDRDIGAPEPLRPDLVEALTDPVARLERERTSLGQYVDAAATVPELSRYAWQLPRAAWRHLFTGGYLDDVFALQSQARSVIEASGDRAATATVLNYLASVHYRRGEMDEAVRLLEQCIALREELGDRDAVAMSMVNLAGVHHVAGRWARSLEVALAVRRMFTPRTGRDELNAIALGYQRLGRYPESLRYHRLRLLMQLEVGDPTRIGDALASIAVVKQRMGKVTIGAARRQVGVALRAMQKANYPYGEAENHNELALLLAAEGRLTEAVASHRAAIDRAAMVHDPTQESRLWHGFGTTLRLTGDDAQARTAFERALLLARQSRLPYPIALAQAGLGDCLLGDDPQEARRLLEQARATLAGLEAPELRDVEKSLVALGGTDHLHSGAGGETMEA